MALMVPKVSIGANGRAMPVIGMGTASLSPEAMLEAIRIGYRHFDTAFVYGSEQPLGEAIAQALHLGLIKSRDELFITSKLWCTSAEKDLVVPAIKKSLGNLQLEYLDLFLIHWPLRLIKEIRQIPVPKEDLLPIDIKSLWEGMEECQNMGLTKAIGVSNFSRKKLEELGSTAKIPPAVNQVEMHPMWQQKELVDFCKTKGIHVTAYSPLGAISTSKRNNQTVASSLVEEIAKAHGKTSAQVCLRWLYEQGVSMLPQSGNKKRMKENLMIFDWALSGEELNTFTQLPQHKTLRPSSFLGSHDLVLDSEEGI
ncbi:hypothetical protein PVL29_000609 [Vitis rotundifolia]|uniref:NADP-dependent oxidoreductase domain-containing protein n=1 Tax=Vitis rotundifolia TaxID=103349 RepID=A0AA39EAQ2_VITRO|nr:hypothetical protein PVL29_000609 [Vitis rotundifolia]